MSNTSVWFLVLLLSVLPTVAVLAGRHTIKVRRQRLLEDLQSAYASKNPGKTLELIPSFEIARYKYDLGLGGDERPKPDRLVYYVFPVLMYAIACGVGLYGCISAANGNLWWAWPNMFLAGVSSPAAAEVAVTPILSEYQRQTAVSLSFGFAGAYIWSIIYLVRRISVYDLSPLSFLRVTLHIVLACFVCLVMRHIAEFVVPNGVSQVQVVALVGLAFLIGFHPTLGLTYLVDALPAAKVKRNHPEALKLSHHLPLDMIDGINAFTKFRLEELDIEDIQTLGTENPILLFVESPYGLYEIFDWIAQAQMIMAVGPQKAIKLREIGIRSIYDLETFMADPKACSFLSKLLFEQGLEDETCRYLVGTWSGALHVQRFRQIWNAMLEAAKDAEDARSVLRWASLR